MNNSIDVKINSIPLFGPPGSGKGTQGKLLSKLPGYFHLSTGDMFRNLDPNSDLGKEVASYMSKRELVPDELLFRLFEQEVYKLTTIGDNYVRILNPEKDKLLPDGIPRTLNQAEEIKKIIDVKKIIYLTTDDNQKLIDRMYTRAKEQNRADDLDPNVMLRGLEVYATETQKVLDMYDPKIILKVDAFMGKPEVIHKYILDNL